MTTSRALHHLAVLFKEQYTSIPPPEVVDLSGKTVIVTGANIGLGYEAAKHFARMRPSKLIIACRDTSKGLAARGSILSDVGANSVKPENLEVWELDLGSSQSVKAFAERFGREGGGKLDILVENAGIATGGFRKSVDGWESTLQVNVISTYHLHFALLPYLRLAPDPRVTVVSSSVSELVTLSPPENAPPQQKIFDRLNDENTRMLARYPESKLLELLITRRLAKELDHYSRVTGTKPIVTTTVNPGLCHSALAREADSFLFRLWKFILARTTEVGSRTLVHAALANSGGAEVSGTYLSTCQPRVLPAWARTEEGVEVGDRVYDELLDIIAAVDPAAVKNVKA